MNKKSIKLIVAGLMGCATFVAIKHIIDRNRKRSDYVLDDDCMSDIFGEDENECFPPQDEEPSSFADDAIWAEPEKEDGSGFEVVDEDGYDTEADI